MMKKLMIGLLVLFLLSTMVACDGPVHTNPQETIDTRVGKGFTIDLHVVKRLGASWQVSYDEEMLTLENEKYTDNNPKSPGLDGTQYFRFAAVKAGEIQIGCSLKHGTSGPVSEQKTFSIQIEGGG